MITSQHNYLRKFGHSVGCGVKCDAATEKMLYIVSIAEYHSKLKQEIDAMSGTTSSDSSISMKVIEQIIDRLCLECNRSSTRKNYYSVWKTFNRFFLRLDERPASWKERLTLFVGYLIQDGRKATMIKSYISAVKAVLSDGGIEINEDRSLLTSLTKACRYVNDHVRH